MLQPAIFLGHGNPMNALAENCYTAGWRRLGENILLMGSGNLLHNLRSYVWEEQTAPYDWAERFETKIKEKMLAGQFEPLVNYQELGKEALLSVPTPDHYFPLLYVLATWQQGEPITFPLEGIDGGSLSMLTVRIG